jgi:hypothetical protein
MDFMRLCVTQVVVPFFYVGWVACLAQLVAGCLVLPSLARQDLRRTSANIIQVGKTAMTSGDFFKQGCWMKDVHQHR